VLSHRLRVLVFLPVLVVATGVGVGSALSASGASGSASTLEQGKALYRTFCGQCHALTAAQAAGFGSDKGLGQDGGPSFNNLKVPYDLSVVAVTEGFTGHDLVAKRMTFQQIDLAAAFLAKATATNPYLARVSDG
jgi:mono/diheme cytochrome c family protein